jgi:MFS family permease
MVPARWPALRHRNYQIFFAGQWASLIGTWMQQAAQLWLVYRLTGQTALLGVLGFCLQIPIFVMAPLGGLVSDTWDRRRILLVTQSLSMVLAFLLAALTATGVVEVWHLLGIASLLGIVNAFDIPTRQAFLTDMVGRADLMNAVALNSSSFHAARILGPAIGGLVIAAVGEAWCFVLNGVSFMAVLASLTAIRLAPRAAPPSARPRLVDGLRFVAANPPVRWVLSLLALVSLTGAPYSVLLPVFANRILDLEARGLGLLMGASGLGALTGALILASRPQPSRLPHVIARSAVVAAVSLVLLAFSRVPALSALALVGIGFGITSQLAASNTLLQMRVPDAVRGRVLSVYAMSFMGTMPIGALLSGWIAERAGVQATVAVGGLCCLAGAAVFATRAVSLLTRDSAGMSTPAAPA